MAGIIGALDKRVAAMNHDVMRIDTKVVMLWAYNLT
jgi:hypothetical protein